VTIFIAITSSTPGSSGTPGSTDVVNGPPAPSCSASAVNISWNNTSRLREGLREHPGSIPFGVRCDNGYFDVVWVPVGGDPPEVVVEVDGVPPVDPRAMAEALLGIVPLPPITVGANPGTGLVALPSWFWVDGYGGEPLSGSDTLGNTTVAVVITPERYDWSFGDGAVLTTESLGRPYPAESDIQHTYERSRTADVQVEITFGGQYQVTTVEDDGEGGTVEVVGPWEPLDPMVRTFSRPYPVQQLQSVLTAGQ